MAPFDFLTAPLRSLLGVTEHAEADVASHTPLHETRELEARLEEAVVAVHRSADSLERHIAVLETLADALPPLTESVTRLTDQLSPLLKVAAPIGAAEREASRVEHFFGRRRHREAVVGAVADQPSVRVVVPAEAAEAPPEGADAPPEGADAPPERADAPPEPPAAA